MHRKVAVEKNLIGIQQHFKNQGYQVDLFTDGELDTIGGVVSNYDAIIISGGNQNFMGMEDTNTKSPIIDAEGMTSEDVFKRVNDQNSFK